MITATPSQDAMRRNAERTPELTLARAFELVGHTVQLSYSDGMEFPVVLVDVKQAYGRFRFTVRGPNGKTINVEESRLKGF